jgi:Zn-dependent peptidase ImmA (M78 family)/transcriptional regulator with XRE-family HTH domain
MSLDDLEKTSGVSRSMIYAYERGRHVPRAETIAKLSAALDVLPSFFFMPGPVAELAPIFMRHLRSKAGAKEMVAVQRQLSWARLVVDSIEEYVVLPDVDVPDFHPPSDPRDISTEDIEKAAHALRRHWSLGDGVIRDVITLLENHGCIVVPEIVQSEHIDAFSQWSVKRRPFVVTNSHHVTGVRWRADMAHELGHLILHRMIDRRFIESNPATHGLIEKQAFRFAGAFLMPKATFEASVPHVSLDALLIAKSQWHLSVAFMLHRCEDIGLIDPQTTGRLYRNLNRRGWKKAEPLDDVLPAEQPQLLANAIRAIAADDPTHLDAICVRTGLEGRDIARYCGVDLAPFQVTDRALPRIRVKRDLGVAGGDG